MNDFMRSLCDTDISGVNTAYKMSEEASGWFDEKDNVLSILKKRLDNDDYETVIKFIDACSTVIRESEYHAFLCGIRFIIQILSGTLSDD